MVLARQTAHAIAQTTMAFSGHATDVYIKKMLLVAVNPPEQATIQEASVKEPLVGLPRRFGSL